MRRSGLPAKRDLASALTELAGAFTGPGPFRTLRALRTALVSVLVRIVFAELREARGLLDLEDERLSSIRAALERSTKSSTTAWPRLIARLAGTADESRRGGLFDRDRDASLATVPIDDVRVAAVLGHVSAFSAEWRARSGSGHDDVDVLGAAFEDLLDVDLVRRNGATVAATNDERRRLGAHYTSRALAKDLVQRTLTPILSTCPSREAILGLRVCDPAMGAGAFLIEAARQLGTALAGTRDSSPSTPAAILEVATHCIYGVDRNPLAVDVARLGLWLALGDRSAPRGAFDRRLQAGDAILANASFSWSRAFPEIFQPPRRGFDAMIGNPPWVSYAGRAAQPLPREVRKAYAASPAFGGYRNLQALFVHRAATLVRPGGRLGFVLPTSMSDLDGYRVSRRAHDELCDVDRELPDFGNSFEGVFQPCMGLLSTKREEPEIAQGKPWPLARTELDGETRAFLERMERLPRFAPGTFGERGFQTNRGDVERLRALSRPAPPFTEALRTGSEVASFERKDAELYANREDFERRLRPAEDWRAVKLLIRQTARYPIAALSDGLAFRNSVLAGFADPSWSEHFLLAYLNASPVRFYHYMRHRDARQGMPQLKIGHLRALPAPLMTTHATRALELMGKTLGQRNAGLTPAERDSIDHLAADILELTQEERARIADFARVVKG